MHKKIKAAQGRLLVVNLVRVQHMAAAANRFPLSAQRHCNQGYDGRKHCGCAEFLGKGNVVTGEGFTRFESHDISSYRKNDLIHFAVRRLPLRGEMHVHFSMPGCEVQGCESLFRDVGLAIMQKRGCISGSYIHLNFCGVKSSFRTPCILPARPLSHPAPDRPFPSRFMHNAFFESEG